MLVKSGYLTRAVKRNTKNKLTVLAFHRVISTLDPRFPPANKQWTMEADVFEQVVQLLNKHFTFVSAQTIQNHYYNIIPLPNNPLLITFDDGWYDNFLYAYPILKKFSIPALFFITTGQIGKSTYFWQEEIYAYCHTNKEKYATIAPRLRRELNSESVEINCLIEGLFKLDEKNRNNLLEIFFPDIGQKQQFQLFIDEEQIKKMYNNGMDFGTHGITHKPLPLTDNPEKEIFGAKQTLEKILPRDITTMSLPHGVYNDTILETCRAAGYKLVFTSDNGLNRKKSNPLKLKRKYMPTWRFQTLGNRIDDSLLTYNTFVDFK